MNTHGTDPTNADTDGGSVSDGDELSNGTDPKDPSDDAAGGDSGDAAEDTDKPGDDTGKRGDESCGCSSGPSTTAGGAVLLLGLGLLRRRRANF